MGIKPSRGNTPKLVPSKAGSDQRITTCKLCGLAVLASQPHGWARKPMGISHIACVEGGIACVEGGPL